MEFDLYINPKSLRAAILLKMKKEKIESYSDDLIGTFKVDRPVVVSPSWEELYNYAKSSSRVTPDYITFATIRFYPQYFEIPTVRVPKVVKEYAEKMLRIVGLSPKSFSFRVL